MGRGWDNYVALGVDNTNANIGAHNSIKSRAQAKNDCVIVVGCPCHILHNASQKAGGEFANIVEFDIEDHCVDLSYWFRNSSKRKSILKEFNEFCDEESANVIEHASTRWLSLEKCVIREIEKFEGIKSYFLSEKFTDARFKRLRKTFEDPMTKVYLQFYQPTLPVSNTLNKLLQAEDPLIYRLHEVKQQFTTKLASKCIEPQVVQNHLQSKNFFSTLDLSQCNQKADRELSVTYSQYNRVSIG